MGFVCIFWCFSSAGFGQRDSIPIVDSAKIVAHPKDTKPATIDSASYYRINGRYFVSFWPSFKAVITGPARWDGDDWLEFGIVVGSSAIMFAGVDQHVKVFFKANTTTFMDGVEDVFYPLGNRLPPLLLTGMYVGSIIARDRRLEHNTLMITKSLVISTIFYTATKAVLRRERPDQTENSRNFTTPFVKNVYTSFPSGHSNTAFSVATGFAMQYKHIKWVPWVAYSLATLTSLSRIYQNRHWASDVIIGSAIGHYVTKTVIRAENRKLDRKKKVKVVP